MPIDCVSLALMHADALLKDVMTAVDTNGDGLINYEGACVRVYLYQVRRSATFLAWPAFEVDGEGRRKSAKEEREGKVQQL